MSMNILFYHKQNAEKRDALGRLSLPENSLPSSKAPSLRELAPPRRWLGEQHTDLIELFSIKTPPVTALPCHPPPGGGLGHLKAPVLLQMAPLPPENGAPGRRALQISGKRNPPATGFHRRPSPL